MTTSVRAIQTLWDDGVRWRSERTVAPTDLPVSVPYVRAQVLRLQNDGEDDEVIEAYIKAATDMAEHDTQMALMPQTWTMVLDGFPSSGRIVLERPPLIGYPTITYYDGDNALQTLEGSPSLVDAVTSGPYAKAEIRPLDGEEWPSSYTRLDAVTVTYEAGFSDTSDPVFALIAAGIGLKVRELYDATDLKIDWHRFWRRRY